ncbi:MAG: DUF4234 domain-containing protein [Clostridia bacterium]|nr:DUF4234 domain-containing protein [Clostridia bacterium]
MAEKKSIPVCIILTIVTFGIYGLIWFIAVHNSTKALANDTSDTTAGVALLLTIVTCGIYGIYWAYKRGKQLEDAFKMRGLPDSDNKAVLYLILFLVISIVAWCLIQNDINKLVDYDNGNRA